jgi:hypothetical protein
VHGDGQTVELAQASSTSTPTAAKRCLAVPRLVQVEWSCAKLLSQSFLLKLAR